MTDTDKAAQEAPVDPRDKALHSEEGLGVGKIQNYYGCLMVRVMDDRPQWGIENYDGTSWQDITEDLLFELLKFNSVSPDHPIYVWDCAANREVER